MKGIIDLTIPQILLAYVFVFVVLFIVRARGIKREREILLSSVRIDRKSVV